MRIFITGMPGVGKTTLALKVAERLKDLGYKVGGFITKEIRKDGRRVGFKIITLDTNEEAILAYVGEGEAKPLGLELEIVPEIVKKFKAGDKLKVQLLFNGKPLKGEIRVRTSEKTISHWTDENGFAEIELEKGVNVISARHVDETATEKYDKRNITTTLTIITE